MVKVYAIYRVLCPPQNFKAILFRKAEFYIIEELQAIVPTSVVIILNFLFNFLLSILLRSAFWQGYRVGGLLLYESSQRPPG